MRLHVLSLPHTETTADYMTCAYTQKVVKFCKAMINRGHEVILYAGEVNDAPCTVHVPCITRQQQVMFFGKHDETDLHRGGFGWEEVKPYWRLFAGNAVAAANGGLMFTSDILCMSTSWPQSLVANNVPAKLRVEYGVGYEGVTLHYPAAYESHAWRHHVYGLRGVHDGKPNDTVIPNLFDPADFDVDDKVRYDMPPKYALYLGRVITRKGVSWAVEMAKRAGIRLVVAGPMELGHDSPDRVEIPADVYYAGVADKEMRAYMMTNAECLLCPTQYIEPFGGVAVEAQLCGTPVIATNWGAFPETVKHGDTGYLVSSIDEGADAIQNIPKLGYSGDDIRAFAEARFGLVPVAKLYEQWFERLLGQ